MKTFLATVSLATILSLSSTTLLAGDHYRHNDRDDYRSHKSHQQNGYDNDYRSHNSHQKMARVTHVEPIYRTVRNKRYQPLQHRRDYPQRQSYTSTIAGGLIGGVIGNQFGKGRGNTAMTIAGTLLGGSVGRDVGHQQSPQATLGYNRHDRREANHFHQQQRLDGYRVTYKYHGQSYTTHMDHYPGKRIPINVSVKPAHHYY